MKLSFEAITLPLSRELALVCVFRRPHWVNVHSFSGADQVHCQAFFREFMRHINLNDSEKIKQFQANTNCT